MWSKNPTPVDEEPAPEPSRFSESLMSVSLVLREMSAVREVILCRGRRLGGIDGAAGTAAATRSRRLFTRRQRPHAAKQRVVFFDPADGDSNLVVQARLIEIANQDALMLKLLIGIAPAPGGHRGEDEIRLAGQHAPAKLL